MAESKIEERIDYEAIRTDTKAMKNLIELKRTQAALDLLPRQIAMAKGELDIEVTRVDKEGNLIRYTKKPGERVQLDAINEVVNNGSPVQVKQIIYSGFIGVNLSEKQIDEKLIEIYNKHKAIESTAEVVDE